MWRRLVLVSGFLGGLLMVVLVVAGGSLWVWQDAINDRERRCVTSGSASA